MKFQHAGGLLIAAALIAACGSQLPATNPAAFPTTTNSPKNASTQIKPLSTDPTAPQTIARHEAPSTEIRTSVVTVTAEIATTAYDAGDVEACRTVRNALSAGDQLKELNNMLTSGSISPIMISLLAGNAKDISPGVAGAIVADAILDFKGASGRLDQAGMFAQTQDLVQYFADSYARLWTACSNVGVRLE